MTQRPDATQWRLVAEREVTTRVRDKTFLGSTAFLLLLVIAALVIGALTSDQADDYTVAVVDDAATRAVESTEPLLAKQADSSATVRAEVYDDPAAAESAVREDDADVALLRVGEGGGYEIVGDDEVPNELGSALSAAVSASRLQANAERAGVPLEELLAGTQTRERLLEGGSDAVTDGVSFAFALLFFVTAIAFGMAIAQSVVQEKESCVVEILAATMPIRSLLWGKIAGNTLLALGQILLVVAVGLIGLMLTGRSDAFADVGPATAWYVAFFVAGFLGLAALLAVAGLLATRQEDLQATTLPGQVLLLVPYLLAFAAPPQVVTWASMFPVASALLMPGRIAGDEAPMWQILLALAIAVVAAVVLVRVGARLYERTLLQTTRRVSYREALRTAEPVAGG